MGVVRVLPLFKVIWTMPVWPFLLIVMFYS